MAQEGATPPRSGFVQPLGQPDLAHKAAQGRLPQTLGGMTRCHVTLNYPDQIERQDETSGRTCR